MDEHIALQTTDYEWLRAYTALSRSGYVTDEIRAAEEAWTAAFKGNPDAIEMARAAPGYPAYVQALRRILRFPLRLFRVTTAAAYEKWQVNPCGKPVGATFSRELATIARETLPAQERLVLMAGFVTEPDAVLMRGRIQGYELVVDCARIKPLNVGLLAA